MTTQIHKRLWLLAVPVVLLLAFSTVAMAQFGVINTVAGNSTPGFSGDGSPATIAQLKFPFGVAVDGAGNLLIADSRNHRVRRVEPSSVIQVQIDIKPGSNHNSINTKSKGVIPVAILSDASFDAPGEVDTSSLTFGTKGEEISLKKCAKDGEDVNGDGLLDLVCHFSTQATEFSVGDTEGVLKGSTIGSVAIEGSDAVHVVK